MATSKKQPRIVQGIVGGTSISTRVIDDPILIEDLYDTYMRYAGAKAAVELKPKAAFHNGFTEEIEPDKKLELIKNDIWTELFGYSIVIVDGDNIQTINPRVNRVGFIYTAFNDKTGEAMEASVRYNPDEKFQGPDIKVPRAPFGLTGEGEKNGFYAFRSLPGLPGVRGLSCLLPLIDVIRAQNKIFMEYSKYAEHQGLAHPVVYIQDLTDPKRAQVRSELTAPRKDKAVILDMKDEFEYKSPQQGAYDPSFMMEFADKYIVRESSINMTMLTGDPMGYLSASNTQVNEWFSAIKEYQDAKLAQYIYLLQAIGMTDDVKFQDPSEPTMEAKFETAKNFREGLEGLASRESILKFINNEILGLEGDEELELADEEEYQTYNMTNQGNNGDKTENDRNQQEQ